MIAKDKERIMITLNKEMLKKLEEYCKHYGVTKSVVINILIAHHIHKDF